MGRIKFVNIINFLFEMKLRCINYNYLNKIYFYRRNLLNNVELYRMGRDKFKL